MSTLKQLLQNLDTDELLELRHQIKIELNHRTIDGQSVRFSRNVEAYARLREKELPWKIQNLGDIVGEKLQRNEVFAYIAAGTGKTQRAIDILNDSYRTNPKTD